MSGCPILPLALSEEEARQRRKEEDYALLLRDGRDVWNEMHTLANSEFKNWRRQKIRQWRLEDESLPEEFRDWAAHKCEEVRHGEVKSMAKQYQKRKLQCWSWWWEEEKQMCVSGKRARRPGEDRAVLDILAEKRPVRARQPSDDWLDDTLLE